MQDPWKVPRHLGGKLIAGPEDLPKVGSPVPPDVVCRPAADAMAGMEPGVHGDLSPMDPVSEPDSAQRNRVVHLLACIDAIKRLRRERLDISERARREEKDPEDSARWLENTRALSSWILSTEASALDHLMEVASLAIQVRMRPFNEETAK